MKTTKILTILVLALGFVVFSAQFIKAASMGTAFTYQGRLIDKKRPADGLYDFQFKLWDSNDPCTGSQLGSPLDMNEVDVLDGHFTVELDFGSGIFDGNAVWLETRVVQSPLGSDPCTLRPLLELTPTPYALYAESAGGDNDWTISDSNMYSAVSGNVGIGTTNPDAKLDITGNQPTLLIKHNGALAGTPGGTTAFGYIKARDNQSTVPQAAIILAREGESSGASDLPTNIMFYTTAGGTSNSSERMRINNAGNVGIGVTSPDEKLTVKGAVSLDEMSAPSATSGYGKIYVKSADSKLYFKDDSGSEYDLTAAGGADSDWTISGNDMYSIPPGNVGIGDASPAAKLTVDGAILRSGSTMYGPMASTHINLGTSSTTSRSGVGFSYCTISGGINNTASYSYATVGGGSNNDANSWYATVGGGLNNSASDDKATVSGGWGNTANNRYATVGGGNLNTASGDCSTVAGGYGNTAGGYYSFAAGCRAKANNVGVFAWADSGIADFNVSVNNRFAARASGGVYFYTNSNLLTGAYLPAGSGSWSAVSDRNAKDNFAPVDNKQILKKLVEIPIEMWKYKPEADSIRHIGPMSQDFYAAFGLGDSEKAITTIDADGISFAAIQGLYELVQEKEAEISGLKERMAAMEGLVARLARFQQGGGL